MNIMPIKEITQSEIAGPIKIEIGIRQKKIFKVLILLIINCIIQLWILALLKIILI